MDRLLARSLREIEAHTGELAQTEIGGFLVKEAAQLLAALRLWRKPNTVPIRPFGTFPRPSTTSL